MSIWANPEVEQLKIVPTALQKGLYTIELRGQTDASGESTTVPRLVRPWGTDRLMRGMWYLKNGLCVDYYAIRPLNHLLRLYL